MYDISLRGIRKPVQIRFHPDDVKEAFGVLSTYHPDNIDGPAAFQQAEEAFSRALVALSTAIDRREQIELDAEDRLRTEYYRGREKGGQA